MAPERHPALSNWLVDLAFRIKAEHEASTEFARRSLVHAMAAGDLLLEAKERLKHGQWMPWLKEHCAIPDRTARLYMRLAENRSQIGNAVANLSIQGAIRLLAEADRQEEYDQLFWRIHDKCVEIEERLKQDDPPLNEAWMKDFRLTIYYLYLLGALCTRLGEHTRLGCSEDEWWQRNYGILTGSKIGNATWGAIQSYREENAISDLLEAA
jgi:Protein of unknown function (DUF3102)